MENNQVAQSIATPVETPLTVPENPEATNRSKKNLKILFIFLTFLIFSFGIITILTVYYNLKIPIISKYKKELILAIYNIPLIPKTPEMIILTAVEKNSSLKTYFTDISMTAQLKGINIELGSLDLQINGQGDISDEKKPAFNVNAKAALNFGGKSYQIDGKLLQKEKTLYAKIDKLPEDLVKIYASPLTYGSPSDTTQKESELKQNLEKLYANWIKYEVASLETNARKDLESNTKNASITTEIKNKTQDFLLKSTILPEVKRRNDETIEGVSTYLLELSPAREKIKSVILEFAKENKSLKNDVYTKSFESLANSIDELHINVWVGKGDAIIRKSSVQAVVDLGLLQNLYKPYAPLPRASNVLGVSDLATTKLAISVVVVLKDVNKSVNISVPDKSISVEKYYQMFSDAFLTKEARELKAKEKIYSTDMTEIGKALTSYYVENKIYPESLMSLSGKYMGLESQVRTRLSDYTYMRNSTKNKYLIYIFNPISNKYSTQYYGITSEYTYPHQLSNFDLKILSE